MKNERTILRGKGQLTIPRVMREALHLAEGDPVDLELRDDAIVLRPRKAIPAGQAWFWTEEWQAGEKEAARDIAKGRTIHHDDDEDFLSSLD